MQGRALKHKARALRRNQTETEKRLWRSLRGGALLGYKFRRQQPLGVYITDFCCLERRLVVELDGSQHATQRLKDQRRTQFMEQEGFRVIRFWDNEVFENITGVLETILKHLEAPPHPDPLPRGERECVRPLEVSFPLPLGERGRPGSD